MTRTRRWPLLACIAGILLCAGFAAWILRGAAVVPSDTVLRGVRTSGEPALLPASAAITVPEAPVAKTPLVPSAPAIEKPPPAGPEYKAAGTARSLSRPLSPQPVSLLLRDASGQPVPGARVEVWTSAASAGFGPDVLSPDWKPDLDFGATPDPRSTVQDPCAAVVADEHGACVVTVPSPEAVVAASSPASADRALSSGLLSATFLCEAVGPFTIVLEPLLTLNAKVLRDDGDPAAGVDVRFFRSFAFFDPRRQRAGIGAPRWPPDAHSDSQGLLTVLVEGKDPLSACAIAGEERTPVYSLHPALKGLPQELRFVGRYAVRGIVTDPQHHALAGAEIRLSRRLLPDCTGKSDEEGSYVVRLVKPGTYTIAATPPDGSHDGFVMADPCSATVTEAVPVAFVNVAFLASAAVQGSVEWDGGERITQGRLSAMPESRSGHELALRQLYALRGTTALVDGSGRFALKGLHPEFTYTLTLEMQGKPDVRQILDGVAPGANDVHIVVPEVARHGASIRGMVRDARTLNPIAGCAVALRRRLIDFHPDESAGIFVPMNPGAGPPVLATDAGAFAFDGLSLGCTYVLDVEAAGHAPATVGPIDVHSGEADVQVTLEALGSLRVRVTTAGGAAAAGATVVLRMPTDLPFATHYLVPTVEQTTDASGETMFADLVPHSYATQAFLGDERSELRSADLGGGAAGQIVLRLQPLEATGVLDVIVRKQGAAAIGGIEVIAFALGPRHGGPYPRIAVIKVATSSLGVAHFEQLVPGIYSVTSSNADQGFGTTEASVDGAAPATVDLPLH